MLSITGPFSLSGYQDFVLTIGSEFLHYVCKHFDSKCGPYELEYFWFDLWHTFSLYCCYVSIWRSHIDDHVKIIVSQHEHTSVPDSSNQLEIIFVIYDLATYAWSAWFAVWPTQTLNRIWRALPRQLFHWPKQIYVSDQFTSLPKHNNKPANYAINTTYGFYDTET